MSTDQPRLSQYELQNMLNSDQLSELWKAFDMQQKHPVHVKILHIPQAALNDFAPKFLQETQKLTSLQHPHIASVIDTQIVTNPQGNNACVVTEYLEGQLLSDFLETTVHAGHFLDPIELITLFNALASAIDYAHQRGVIHGAIQPSNVILYKHDAGSNVMGEAKLLGFGMHHLIPAQALPLETTRYISPERAQNLHENLRSDIYALGILLYEFSTGALPFQGETPGEILTQQIQAIPTSPALINPHIRPALTAVIMRCLAKEPAYRFPTATALVAAAARALQVSKDFPNLTNTTPSHTPSSLPGLSGPLPVYSDPASYPTYLTPTPSQQPASAFLTVPTAGNYPPTQTPQTWGPGSTPAQSWSPGNTPAQTPQSWNTGSTPAQSWNTGGTPTIQAPNNSSPFNTQGPPTDYAAAETMPPPPYKAKKAQGPDKLYIAVVALLILTLFTSAFAIYLVVQRGQLANNPPVPSAPIIGQAFFVSSGQLNPNTIQGTADRMQISLHNVPDPAAGQSYYIWLLSENGNSNEAQPVLLATSIHGGQVTTTFQGDNQHNNLLASYSRILITEESSDTPPANPSLDPKTHRFASQFSNVPNPEDTNHYSLLDHLRHLLSQDPKLQAAQLSGGLDLWLLKNTMTILEMAGSMHDSKDVNFIQRQLVRILDYLDSSSYIQTENLPAGLPPVLIDKNIAKVAILNFDPQQNPPGYLKHIGNHLLAITSSDGVSTDQKALAIQIDNAINNVQAWMDKVHVDAQKLIHLPANQLTQPTGQQLLDDLFTQANNALVGQTDPNTNQIKEGVIQIHYNIQRLATFDLTSCQGNTGSGCE